MTSAVARISDLQVQLRAPSDGGLGDRMVVSVTDPARVTGLGPCCRRAAAYAVRASLQRLSNGDGNLLSPNRAWAAARAGGRRADRRTASALATASEDLTARRSGQALVSWLGGRASPVPTYARLAHATPDAALEELAEQAAANGHQAVLVAPFDLCRPHHVQEGLDRLDAVREAVGPNVDIMVDLEGALSADQLRQAAGRLRDIGPRWIQGVAPVTDVQALHAARAAVDIPLAGGQDASDLDGLLPAIEHGLLDVVLLDLLEVGGPGRLYDMLGALRCYGLELSVVGAGGPIATAASGHVLSALGAGQLEIDFGHTRRDLVTPREQVLGSLWWPIGYGRAEGLGLQLVDNAWSTIEVSAGATVAS